MHVQAPQSYQQNAAGRQYGPPSSQGGEQWQGAAWSGPVQAASYQQGSPAYAAGPPAGQGEPGWRSGAQPQQGDPCGHPPGAWPSPMFLTSLMGDIVLAWLH